MKVYKYERKPFRCPHPNYDVCVGGECPSYRVRSKFVKVPYCVTYQCGG